MVGLRTKLASSYIMVVLFCVALISILANVFLERQFREYILENQERRNHQIVNSLSQQYEGEGRWKTLVISEIGINALEQGLIVKVFDHTGYTLWDATLHNNGMCQQMISHLSENMVSRYPNWKGGYVENQYPIIRNFKKVGSIRIGYYGPFYFTDSDLAFINTLNRILFGVAVIALFLAFLASAIMAKRISAPIARVIKTAETLAHGSYEVKSIEKTNIREISQLNSAVNELAVNLQKQELLRKQLTADVAHELRTPLATLQSHIEAIIDGIWEASPERLNVCHAEITRLSRMVQELSKLAKYENQNLILHKTNFDISDLAKQIVFNFETEFIRQGVKINFTGDNVIITADKDQISQVLINLIANSLKYTPTRGSVDIAVHQFEPKEGLVISVKDTGFGISPADLPYIFERFYRSDKSRNRFTGGSGIGLTIVKAVVDAHQGTISVQSKLGEGSEFTVFLPKCSV